MKKIAITCTTVILLSTGLLGACGNPDDTGTNTQSMNRGARMNSEGPVTDMMTPDNGYAGMRGNNYGTGFYGAGSQGAGNDFRGTRGYGYTNNQGLKMDGTSVKRSSYRNTQHGKGLARGITGDNRVGMIDDNGMIYDGATHMETGQNKKLPRDSRFGVESRDGMRNQGHDSEMNYDDNYDGETVENIRTHVAEIDGVKDSRVMVYDDQVVVAVMQDDNHHGDLEQDIKDGIKNLTNGKDVRVLTDDEAFNRVQETDDRLRNGEAFDNVRDTVNDMMKDLGDAAQRPFEGMRR
ncbi:YhcN/YlaJ family sporulation lipoprotein [Alkalicoccobacillus porphyridii]|uniref:Uncharacterized protein n=1 Tax=Alkalicoccobacillus porphyridii TaxID=2597270 RepID=A0A553ZWM6_9BACI|nr:YhcN/YlaJ family sporulation lipoprotein [Alkalicoccobacillus porphyridii]TSB45765.1 hypothetical protein FN960_14870 [Alkalicoccobacillus porphyridii]